MRVLITGGCGFLGSHACEWYKQAGAEVVAFDNLDRHELNRTGYDVERARQYNYYLLSDLGVEVFVADIRDESEVKAAAEGCDFIIHAAAQPAMTIAIESPRKDFSVNVKGTLNVLQAARDLGIPLVNCSSIHVYGNGINQALGEEETRFRREPAGISEDAPLLTGEVTPLHASKRAAEIYVQAFIDTYGLIAANFRLTGMYGPRQMGGMDHGWVANFAIRTRFGAPITVFGTDKQVRDILYVTDAVRACDAFYRRPVPGTYNIGGGIGMATSIRECLDILADLTGRELRVEHLPRRQGDLHYFVCDITKAKAELGWEPCVQPLEGLQRLLDWIEANTDIFAKEGAAV